MDEEIETERMKVRTHEMKEGKERVKKADTAQTRPTQETDKDRSATIHLKLYKFPIIFWCYNEQANEIMKFANNAAIHLK